MGKLFRLRGEIATHTSPHILSLITSSRIKFLHSSVVRVHVLLSYAMEVVHFMNVYMENVNYNDDNKLRLQKEGGEEKVFHICCLSFVQSSLSGSKLESVMISQMNCLRTHSAHIEHKGQSHIWMFVCLALSILDLITAHYTLTFHFIKIIDLTSTKQFPPPSTLPVCAACVHNFDLMKQTCFCAHRLNWCRRLIGN